MHWLNPELIDTHPKCCSNERDLMIERFYREQSVERLRRQRRRQVLVAWLARPARASRGLRLLRRLRRLRVATA